jgi:hypothetical protein
MRLKGGLLPCMCGVEVIFKRKKGYFKETGSNQVKEKLDMDGNVIGFSILKGSSLKKRILDVELAGAKG